MRLFSKVHSNILDATIFFKHAEWTRVMGLSLQPVVLGVFYPLISLFGSFACGEHITLLLGNTYMERANLKFKATVSQEEI